MHRPPCGAEEEARKEDAARAKRENEEKKEEKKNAAKNKKDKKDKKEKKDKKDKKDKKEKKETKKKELQNGNVKFVVAVNIGHELSQKSDQDPVVVPARVPTLGAIREELQRAGPQKI